MASSWSREANTTISNYFKTVEDATLRRRIVLAMLMDKGKILYNQHGTDLVWRVKYRQAPTVGLSDGMGFGSISQQDRWKTATLDWRAFGTSDAIGKMEQLKNDGPQAIVRVVKQMAQSLAYDMETSFAEQLYVDGNASGNESTLHGFNSFTSVSGGATAGFVGINNDTYAGLSTTLGNYGGSWSADSWPLAGTGDTTYDFWTPVVIDYSDTAWTASTKTWPNTCLEAMRAGIMAVQKNGAMLDLITLDLQMFRQFKDKVQAEEQINVTRGAGDSAPYRLGFKDVIFFDGTEVGWEYGVPVDSNGNGQGFGWSFDIVELLCMQDRMFVTAQDTKVDEQTYRVTVDFFGNLKFGNERGGIRNLLKLAKVT